MNLKKHINDYLDKEIIEYKTDISNFRKSKRFLEKADLENSTYVVNLQSCWAREGEESVVVEVKGNLEKAIGIAEAEFIEINERYDVQAFYNVKIKLKGIAFSVPEELWTKYKFKSFL